MDTAAGSSKRKNSGSSHATLAKRPREAGSMVCQNDAPIKPPRCPKTRDDFEIVIICALTLEADAVEGLDVLDDCQWYADGAKGYGKASGDPNTYSTGYIAGHNVVLAHMPGMGTINAAAVASNCRLSFPNIRLALVVGVCGAIPFYVGQRNVKKEVFLSDVIISHRVIQYDLGSQLPDRFEQKNTLLSALGRPIPEILSFMAKLKTNRTLNRLQGSTSLYLEALQTREDLAAQYPGTHEDKLFKATCQHTTDKLPCPQAGCKDQPLLRLRVTQNQPKPALHFGMIASGNTVMKSGVHRDKIAEKFEDLIAFEMEGSGVWDVFPCVVIKGACDYCDSHKTGEWQPYAAAAAAACLKAFLEEWVSSSKNEFIDSPELQELQSEAPGVDKAPKNSSLGSDIKQKLIELLYFTQIDSRLTNLKTAQRNTCRWFFDTPKYLAWRDLSLQSGHSGFLWIKGNPGTGKSTLMKLLFEEALAMAAGDSSQITLSFFFLAQATIEERSTEGLYRSLLHQIFEKVKDLDGCLEWMTPSGARGIAETGWKEEALKRTLMHVVSELQSHSLTIYIDALDECDRAQAVNMVCFFEDLCDRARETKARLRICFSSRYYPDIRTEEENQIALEAEEGHDCDIKEYIQVRLEAILKGSDESLIETLQSEVFKKSSGIFLWVVMAIDLLATEDDSSTQAMCNRLRELPSGLANLFERIITRDGENIERLHVCLKCVLFAQRPLKPEELYFAVQLGLDKSNSGYWDQKDVKLKQMRTFVRTSSKGLAEVTRNKAREVQFIHESVRGFLMDRYSDKWSGSSENLEGHCHNLIRDICLAQMTAPTHESAHIPVVYRNTANLSRQAQRTTATEIRKTLKLKIPFLKYSTRNVLYHASCAHQHGIDQAIFLQNFPLQRFVVLNNAFEKEKVRLYSVSVSLPYILAERGLTSLILAHYQPESYFADEDERYGPPLFAALATGNQKAAGKMLADHRIWSQLPCNIQYELWTEYCYSAAESSNIDRQFVYSRLKGVLWHLILPRDELILQAFILSKRMPRDKNLKRSWSLLYSEYRDILMNLSDPKFNPELDAKINNGDTPLLWAAQHGCGILVQQLLRAVSNVGEKDKLVQTALLQAAAFDHSDIVGKLLEAGANINSRHKDGQTLLSAAIEKHQYTMVEMLLEGGATLNSRDENHLGTLLENAVTKRLGNLLKLLLQKGASVDFKDKDGRTPLSKAASVYTGESIYTADAIVQQLLDNGADVNSIDNQGRTPLSWAAEHEHAEKIVKLLLDNGADINSRDKFGRTPLSWAAARGGSEKNMKLLLDNGAEINSRDDQGQTPLSFAAQWYYSEKTIKLLLDNGAEINSRDDRGRTPLFRAAEWGSSEDVIKLLLDNGADINSRDNQGWTPLSCARRGGVEKNIKLLLDRGADTIDCNLAE